MRKIGTHRQNNDTNTENDSKVIATASELNNKQVRYQNTIDQPYKYNQDLIRLFNDKEGIHGRMRLEDMENIRWVGDPYSDNIPCLQKRLIFQTKLANGRKINEDFLI